MEPTELENSENIFPEGEESASDPPTPLEVLQNFTHSVNYLPQDINDCVLQTFIDWAEEDASNFILNFYKSRMNYKKVFRNRKIEKDGRFSAMKVATFPRKEFSDEILFGIWLNDANDSDEFSIYHQAKLVLAELDLLLEMGCLSAEKRVEVILDMARYTEKQVERITPYAAFTLSKIFNTCVPVERGPIFIINAPNWVSKFTKLFPTLDFRIVESLEDLAKIIDKEVLPSDMGGYPEAPARNDFAEKFEERMRNHEGWFMSEDEKREKELNAYSTAKDPVIKTDVEPPKKKPKKKQK